MSQHSRKSLFFTLLVTGILEYSSGAFAGCTPSVTSTSNYSTCIGTGALQNSSNASYRNTAVGNGALYYSSTGINNTSAGNQSLYYNTAGSYNTSVGNYALYSNTIGSSNTSVGSTTLYSNTTGNNNISVGGSALFYNTTGSSNTAMGTATLYSNTTGSYNVAIGRDAGSKLTRGFNNIDIANAGVAGESATIRIGTQGTQTKTFLAGVYGTTITGTTVTVNSSGQLGVALSSRRYKDDIKPMGSVSDRLLELRPVTFHYKKPDEDGKKPIQYGLIAEEVDAVMPELVVRNTDGSPETVAYQSIPSLLLNEYQKQHKELVAEKAALAIEKAELSETKAKLASVEKTAAQKMAEMQSQIHKLNAITKKLLAALPTSTKTAMAK